MPTAMEHPAYDREPADMADLTTVGELGKRAPSDPEVIRLIRAFNAAPGALPETPHRTLLEQLAVDADAYRAGLLADTEVSDDHSNGIVYLKTEKFVHAVGLSSLLYGRDDLKNGTSSRSVIQKYKDMSPYTMPPVSTVIGYYERQSGNTYYSLIKDGTHRLAGAALRGDEYIPATDVAFVALDDDVITRQLAELEAREAEQQATRRKGFGRGILGRLGLHRPSDK